MFISDLENFSMMQKSQLILHSPVKLTLDEGDSPHLTSPNLSKQATDFLHLLQTKVVISNEN